MLAARICVLSCGDSFALLHRFPRPVDLRRAKFRRGDSVQLRVEGRGNKSTVYGVQ